VKTAQSKEYWNGALISEHPLFNSLSPMKTTNGEYALGDFVEIQENIYRIKSIYHVEGDQNLKMDVERLKLRSKGSNELVYTNVSTRMDPNLIANKIHVSMDKPETGSRDWYATRYVDNSLITSVSNRNPYLPDLIKTEVKNPKGLKANCTPDA